MYISKHINTDSDNVLCPCCGKGTLNKKTIAMFENLRAYLVSNVDKNIKLKISSGCRCMKKNRSLQKQGYKASNFSRHLIIRGCLAVDLHAVGFQTKKLVEICAMLHNRNEILTGETVLYDWGVHIASGRKTRLKDFRTK